MANGNVTNGTQKNGLIIMAVGALIAITTFSGLAAIFMFSLSLWVQPVNNRLDHMEKMIERLMHSNVMRDTK